MRGMLIILLALTCLHAYAKTLTIAVIDTGIDRETTPRLCHSGHESYLKIAVDNGLFSPTTYMKANPLKDPHGHGTHVAGLISKFADDGDYCIVSLQYYDSTYRDGEHNIQREEQAFRHAIDINVDFINLSGGGFGFQRLERDLIEEALNKGITVVVAAGNDNQDLNQSCDYYPACYDRRLIVVGNLEATNGLKCGDNPMSANSKSYVVPKAWSSNYGGTVDRWEIGTQCISNLPGGRPGMMSGTSQSAAIATGKLVKERLSSRHGTK